MNDMNTEESVRVYGSLSILYILYTNTAQPQRTDHNEHTHTRSRE